MVKVSPPAEWFWVGVVVCDVSVDGGLQIDDAEEGPALRRRLVSAAKNPFAGDGRGPET